MSAYRLPPLLFKYSVTEWFPVFVCYRWFCEGKELENSPDIQIITDGEHHSLIIAEAFEEDTGRYSCFASNFYGTDSTSAEIYVEGDASSSLSFSMTITVKLNLVCLHQQAPPLQILREISTLSMYLCEFLSY